MFRSSVDMMQQMVEYWEVTKDFAAIVGYKRAGELAKLRRQDDWGAEKTPQIIRIISTRELYKDW